MGCWASAPENDATAIRPATAETVLPELFSITWPTELIAVLKTRDFGAFTLLMMRSLNEYGLVRNFVGATIRPNVVLSSEEIRVNATAATVLFESGERKAILICVC